MIRPETIFEFFYMTDFDTFIFWYPKGVSPVGALDMAGNVIEWCLNEFNDPHRIKKTGYARRVLRGGSWLFQKFRARSDYRNFGPSGRSDNVGFRLACSRPPTL